MTTGRRSTPAPPTDGGKVFTLIQDFTRRVGEAMLACEPGADTTLINLDVNGDGVADSVIHVAGDQTPFDHHTLRCGRRRGRIPRPDLAGTLLSCANFYAEDSL